MVETIFYKTENDHIKRDGGSTRVTRDPDLCSDKT